MNSELYVYRPVPPLCKETPSDDHTPVPTHVVFGLVGLLQRYVAAWDGPQHGTSDEVHASRQLMAAMCRGLATLVEALDARETAEEGASDEPVCRR